MQTYIRIKITRKNIDSDRKIRETNSVIHLVLREFNFPIVGVLYFIVIRNENFREKSEKEEWWSLYLFFNTSKDSKSFAFFLCASKNVLYALYEMGFHEFVRTV